MLAITSVVTAEPYISAISIFLAELGLIVTSFSVAFTNVLFFSLSYVILNPYFTPPTPTSPSPELINDLFINDFLLTSVSKKPLLVTV